MSDAVNPVADAALLGLVHVVDEGMPFVEEDGENLFGDSDSDSDSDSDEFAPRKGKGKGKKKRKRTMCR